MPAARRRRRASARAAPAPPAAAPSGSPPLRAPAQHAEREHRARRSASAGVQRARSVIAGLVVIAVGALEQRRRAPWRRRSSPRRRGSRNQALKPNSPSMPKCGCSVTNELGQHRQAEHDDEARATAGGSCRGRSSQCLRSIASASGHQPGAPARAAGRERRTSHGAPPRWRTSATTIGHGASPCAAASPAAAGARRRPGRRSAGSSRR